MVYFCVLCPERRKQDVVYLQHCFPLALGSAFLASPLMLQVFFHKQKLCFMNTFTLAPAGVSLRTRALENTPPTLQKYRMQMTVFRLVVWFTWGALVLQVWHSKLQARATSLVRRSRCSARETTDNGDLTSEAVQTYCTFNVQRQRYTEAAFVSDQVVGTHRRCQTSDDRRCTCYVWFKAINPHDRQGGIIVLAPCARRPAWRPSKATRRPASLVEGVCTNVTTPLPYLRQWRIHIMSDLR